MRTFVLNFFIVLFVVPIFGQNPVGFDSNCKKYIAGTVPLVYPAQLYSVIKNPNTILLDARGKNEYETSHIYKAKFVGYDTFKESSLSSLSKTDSIYIYCSIGYRSEKIGEKLLALGFKNVFNLYGGVFNWVNSGYKVTGNNGKQTTEVHGYDKEWSKMLNPKRCSIKLNE